MRVKFPTTLDAYLKKEKFTTQFGMMHRLGENSNFLRHSVFPTDGQYFI